MLQEKILIIVQDQNNGKKLQKLFLNSGFQVILVTDDSYKALRFLRTQEVGLTLIDTGFAGMSYKQFAEVIDYENLGPLIILGSESLPAFQELPPSVYGILSSPVTKEQLLTSSKMAIRQYRVNYKLKEELHNLRKKLSERKIVDQAKFILMKKDNIDEDQAYEKIRKVSMNRRMSIKKVSEIIISQK